VAPDHGAVGAVPREAERMTIVDFLMQRIAEDEASARAAVGNDGPPTWLPDDADGVYGVRPDVDWDEVCQSHTYGVPNECEFNPTACGISITDDQVLEHARARHIARHDPARVLADCEAKRRIVGLHERRPDWPDCQECGDRDDIKPWPCSTLRLLALPYADHPDYRPEWRTRAPEYQD